MHYSELDNGINLIKLNGKLDIIGASEIENKFAGYCSGDKAVSYTHLTLPTSDLV